MLSLDNSARARAKQASAFVRLDMCVSMCSFANVLWAGVLGQGRLGKGALGKCALGHSI